MFSNDDFFKAIITFFVTTIFFFLVLFFGSFLSLSNDPLVKEFVTIILYLSLTSIIIFPLYFVVFPFYKHYWVNGEENETNYRTGEIFAIFMLIIEFLVVFWIVLMISVILYYPIFKNVLKIF